MFDAEMERLIRSAPRLNGIEPERLPQQMSEDFAALVLAAAATDPVDRATRERRLQRMARTYEALVDLREAGEERRAAAFVAGTARRLLMAFEDTDPGFDAHRVLTKGAISSRVAAPLLFLIAGQFADAREMGRPLIGLWKGDVILAALVESIGDLSAERMQSIVDRAERLRSQRLPASDDIEDEAATALFGMCWRGLVLLASEILKVDPPQTRLFPFVTPGEAFDRVLAMASAELDGEGTVQYLATYSGPRHLARLLRTLADDLIPASVTRLPSPIGGEAEGARWDRWLRHRAKSKPVLWPNHRAALSSDFHKLGTSAVLVFPTGAGKTTVAEIKIAATLCSGRSVVFLVPTLSLVDQLSRDLKKSFPAEVIEKDSALTNFEDVEFGQVFPTIRVMTPERCLSAQAFQPESFSDVGLLVLDECHILNDRGRRGLDAMLALLRTLSLCPGADILLLSAMIENAVELAEWLARETGRPCRAIVDDWRPSRQARGVLVYSNADLGRVRERVALVWGRGKDPNQAAQQELTVRPMGLFGLSKHWLQQPEADTKILPLLSTEVHISATKRDWGRIDLTPNRNFVAAELGSALARAGLKTLVFVGQPAWTASTASDISAALAPDAEIKLDEEENALAKAIEAELGDLSYALVKEPYDTVVHHADLILLERWLAESLFRRDDGARAIVATPTLSQGMNLPVEAVILAGDSRHDRGKKKPISLETHEILNAAGRAGRAGHLANGFVLLIPSDLIGIDLGMGSEVAQEKLQVLVPPTDRCVTIVDPLARLLDRIELAQVPDRDLTYALERIGGLAAGEPAEHTVEGILQRSFAAFVYRRRAEEAVFDEKVLRFRRLVDGLPQMDAKVLEGIAAKTGLPRAAVTTLADPLMKSKEKPKSVSGWVNWLFDCLSENHGLFELLVGAEECEEILAVTRMVKKNKGDFNEEINRLRSALLAWICGKPLNLIESILIGAPVRGGSLPNARELGNSLAPRTFAFLIGTVGGLARAIAEHAGDEVIGPAVLESLYATIQKGYDSPSKLIWGQNNPELRSRVQVHLDYRMNAGAIGLDASDDLAEIRRKVEAAIAGAP